MGCHWRRKSAEEQRRRRHRWWRQRGQRERWRCYAGTGSVARAPCPHEALVRCTQRYLCSSSGSPSSKACPCSRPRRILVSLPSMLYCNLLIIPIIQTNSQLFLNHQSIKFEKNQIFVTKLTFKLELSK